MISLPKEAEIVVTAAFKIAGVVAAIGIVIRLIGGGIGDFVAVLATVLVLVCALEVIRHLA